jgi:hypothetical protein
MNWLLRRRFLALLLALLMLLVAYPFLRKAYDTRLLLDVLFTAVFLAALLVVFPSKRFRVVALLLGLPPLVGLWTDYVLPAVPRIPLSVGFLVVAAVFLAFCVASILRDIYRQGKVSADSIFGAFCGYLLVGLIFSHLYCLIEWAEPGSFQANEAILLRLHQEGQRFFLLAYFSFMTLTTVGYGDITPVAEGAQALAVVEALLGQLYIAVLIAELIGKRVASLVGGEGPTGVAVGARTEPAARP